MKTIIIRGTDKLIDDIEEKAREIHANVDVTNTDYMDVSEDGKKGNIYFSISNDLEHAYMEDQVDKYAKTNNIEIGDIDTFHIASNIIKSETYKETKDSILKNNINNYLNYIL